MLTTRAVFGVFLLALPLCACIDKPAGHESLAIDVGHSIAKPGAISARGRPEFEFNLALARRVHALMAARGVVSFLVGEDGAMTQLPDRTTQAASATFFLSIHHDAVQPHYLSAWTWNGAEQKYSDHYSGFSLFVSRRNPQPDLSLRCASAIGATLRRDGFHYTEHHAEPIAGENREFADRENGVYFFDDLVVLKTARQAAVLLEAGVIVNRDEEAALQDPARQARIADAVHRGLKDCGAVN